MELTYKIIELWHLSRTALSGGDTSRHSRMIYIKNELNRTYPEFIKGMSAKAVWLEIEKAIN